MTGEALGARSTAPKRNARSPFIKFFRPRNRFENPSLTMVYRFRGLPDWPSALEPQWLHNYAARLRPFPRRSGAHFTKLFSALDRFDCSFFRGGIEIFACPKRTL